MKDFFNLKQYLAEGWMQQGVGRPKSINSEGSLYRWVEANCNNLDDVLRLNPKELQEPVSVAKEEGLSPREFIEDWVAEYGDWVDIAEMLGLRVVKDSKVGKDSNDALNNSVVDKIAESGLLSFPDGMVTLITGGPLKGYYIGCDEEKDTVLFSKDGIRVKTITHNHNFYNFRYNSLLKHLLNVCRNKEFKYVEEDSLFQSFE